MCENKVMRKKPFICNGNSLYFDRSNGDNRSKEIVDDTSYTYFKCGGTNETFILSELLCNDVKDCADGSDEGSYCLWINKNTNIVLLIVGGCLVCATYVYILFKNRRERISKGILKWLLSPMCNVCTCLKNIYSCFHMHCCCNRDIETAIDENHEEENNSTNMTSEPVTIEMRHQ